MNWIKDEEIAFLTKQLKEMRDKHENAQSKMESTQNDPGKTRQELDSTWEHFSFFERKEKLYPFKKKKIYQDATEITTLTERDQMKIRITVEKTDYSPPLSDPSNSDSDSSIGSLFINFGWDFDLEVELNASNAMENRIEQSQTVPKGDNPANKQKEDLNI